MIPSLAFAVLSLSAGISSAAPVVTLPPLTYGYDALVPIISKQIMTLHHDLHHKGQVDALNAAEEKLATIQGNEIEDVLQRNILANTIKFNGGGHINHSQFWKILSPTPDKGGSGGVFNDGQLKTDITNTFGSVQNFITQFNNATNVIQGSGWGWLGYDQKTKELRIVTTANQDPLTDLEVILGVDVFEHAYYLDYFNGRATYLDKIWGIINWTEAEARYKTATSAPPPA